MVRFERILWKGWLIFMSRLEVPKPCPFCGGRSIIDVFMDWKLDYDYICTNPKTKWIYPVKRREIKNG